MNVNEFGIDIDKIASDLTEEISAETIGDPSKSLLSPQAQKERLKHEILESLNIHFKSISNGINCLLTHMQKMINDQNPSVDEKTYNEILRKMSEKKTNELTNQELTALFAVAVDLYNHQEYDNAADAFYVLTEFDIGQALFWKCLGNARFYGNHFKGAIEAYDTSLKLNQNDPESLVYQARCLQKENRVQLAIDLLHHAKEITAKDSHFETLNDAVVSLLQELEKK